MKRIITPETRQKMVIGIKRYYETHSSYWKGKQMPTEYVKKIQEARKGYRPTEETKKKMSEAAKGRRAWNKKEPIKKVCKCGKVFYVRPSWGYQQACSWSCGRSGSNSHLWKGGITPINALIRSSKKYADWRKQVFERDNYVCIWCGQWGGKLNADHIKPFAKFPELRFELSNGRTLCVPCHIQTETFG